MKLWEMPLMFQEMLTGIDQAENYHHPERNAREKEKHPEKVSAMEKTGRDRNHVPARLGK